MVCFMGSGVQMFRFVTRGECFTKDVARWLRGHGNYCVKN